MAGIVPRSEARGVDFCGGTGSDIQIVRSDLKCYMSLSDVHTGEGATVHPLHPSCCGGEHYFATYSSPGLGSKEKNYYIIKGNEFRRVTDLTSDAEARTGVLNRSCQGGDFYIGTSKYLKATSIPMFIIVFVKKGLFRVVTNLETGVRDPRIEWGSEYPLNKEMLDGLYFWGTKTKTAGRLAFYVVKPVGAWGLQYYCTNNLTTEGEGTGRMSSFHPSVTNFLPGGLGLTKGPTVGGWKLIKSFTNQSSSTVEGMQYEVNMTVGHNKKSLSSIEHNWNLTTSIANEVSAGFTVEKVFEATVKGQFSLSRSFGGKNIHTTDEDWKEEVKIKESYDIGKFPPGRTVYIWQYKVSLRDTEDILQSKHWAITDTANPPSTDPQAHY